MDNTVLAITGGAIGVAILGVLYYMSPKSESSTSDVNFEVDPRTGTFYRIRGGKSKKQKLSKKKNSMKRRK